MSKRKIRVTFEVDPIKLFDMLHSVKDWHPAGDRILGILMTGEPSFKEHVALDLYGITITSAEKIDVTVEPAESDRGSQPPASDVCGGAGNG